MQKSPGESDVPQGDLFRGAQLFRVQDPPNGITTDRLRPGVQKPSHDLLLTAGDLRPQKKRSKTPILKLHFLDQPQALREALSVV